MKMKTSVVALFATVGTFGLSGCAAENEAATGQAMIQKGGDERTGEYNAVADWWKPAPDHDENWTWGQGGAVAADTPDRIIVGMWGDMGATSMAGVSGERIPAEMRPVERPGGTNYVVVVDGDGNIIERWSQWDSIFNRPHALYISPYDPERHVWLVERGGNGVHEQILKFSNDGSELVMQLRDPNPVGTRDEVRANPNPGPLDFGQNASLAFLPDGSFLLADGYWNSRIVKYDADGEYVMEWGELGSGPGQFDLLHGVDVDREGRVYVADRGNSRVQVFTAEGEYIEEWPDIYFPVDVSVDENDAVWVTSAVLNRIMKFNTSGEYQYGWGTYGFTSRGFGPPGSPERWENESGRAPGGMARPHQIDVDQDGNVYVVNFDSGHVDKYVPKPDADPNKLVGRSLGYSVSD
ncbi:MAG: 6-bladed beta-propeller [Gemmatimonadota bacterium]|nr:6-bladed beta-propeller [Gemmatimonadota bacterium]